MEILDHFKNHIKHHRPALDIEEVATGEVIDVLCDEMRWEGMGWNGMGWNVM